MKNKLLPLVAAMCLAFGTFQQVHAANATAPGQVKKSDAGLTDQDSGATIQELTENADLVFQGTVTGINYSNSTSADGTPPVAHTFITYAISEVIAGSYPDPTITLRFEGGVNDVTGLTTVIDEAPTFDVGDEDILFVKDNGAASCPLVGCGDGRIRVINGQLQDEEGYQLTANSIDAKLKKGVRVPSSKVDKYKVGRMTFTRHYSPDEANGTTDKTPPVKIADLKTKTRKLKTTGKKIVPASPHAPFTFNLISTTTGANTLEPSATDPTPSPAGESPVSPEELSILYTQDVATHAAASADFTVEIPGLNPQ